MKARKEPKFFIPLNPLKKAKNLRKIGLQTFDTETKDGLAGKELFCWALSYRSPVMTKNGAMNEIQVIQGDDNLSPVFEKWKQWKDKKHPKIVYVHNLIFDARFLIHFMAEFEIYYYPVISGSSLLALSLMDKQNPDKQYNIKIIDSVQFLKSSQEQAEIEWEIKSKVSKAETNALMAELFKNPKYKDGLKPFNLWSKEEKDQLRKHNRNDVYALQLVMEQFRETLWEISRVDCAQCISLAALALLAYRKEMLEPIVNPMVFKSFNKETNRFTYDYDDIAEKFIRESYYGGRCEVINKSLRINKAYYDRVSMYSAEMKFHPYPKGQSRWLNDYDKMEAMRIIKMSESDNGYKLGIFYVRISPPEEKPFYPVPPKRINRRVMFTNCIIEGIYTSVELHYCWECGYKIELLSMSMKSDIHKNEYVRNVIGIIWDELAYYFEGFVDKFFAMKSEYKGGKKKGAKIILNAVYGKFGQKFVQQSPVIKYFVEEKEAFNYVMAPENREKNIHMSKNIENPVWITMYLENKTIVKPFMNIVIATFTTSYSRISLIKEIHKKEKQIIMTDYLDTDSLTIDDDKRIVEGYNLGNWNIEHKFEKVKFLAPKAYLAIINGKYQIKLKGVNSNHLRQIEAKADKEGLTMEQVEEILREKIIMVEKYMNYKESHRAGIILGSKVPSKHYSFENTKREFFTDGTSVPWTDKTLDKKFLSDCKKIGFEVL